MLVGPTGEVASSLHDGSKVEWIRNKLLEMEGLKPDAEPATPVCAFYPWV